MEYIHPKEEEPKFKCAECDKTFRIEAGYKLHMQNHEAEREALTNKYVCDGKLLTTGMELFVPPVSQPRGCRHGLCTKYKMSPT